MYQKLNRPEKESSSLKQSLVFFVSNGPKRLRNFDKTNTLCLIFNSPPVLTISLKYREINKTNRCLFVLRLLSFAFVIKTFSKCSKYSNFIALQIKGFCAEKIFSNEIFFTKSGDLQCRECKG